MPEMLKTEAQLLESGEWKATVEVRKPDVMRYWRSFHPALTEAQVWIERVVARERLS